MVALPLWEEGGVVSLQNSSWDNPRLSHGVLMEHMSNSGTASRAGVHCRCSSSDLINRAHGFLLSGSSIGLMHINKLHLSSISEEALTVIPKCRICLEASLHFASPSCTGFSFCFTWAEGSCRLCNWFPVFSSWRQTLHKEEHFQHSLKLSGSG